jgi:hypothetical protein
MIRQPDHNTFSNNTLDWVHDWFPTLFVNDREYLLEPTSDHTGTEPARQLESDGIGKRDHSLRIRGNHTVAYAFERHPPTLLGVKERSLRPLLFRNVAGNFGGTENAAFPVPHW